MSGVLEAGTVVLHPVNATANTRARISISTILARVPFPPQLRHNATHSSMRKYTISGLPSEVASLASWAKVTLLDGVVRLGLMARDTKPDTSVAAPVGWA
jgi:hypothetical protein